MTGAISSVDRITAGSQAGRRFALVIASDTQLEIAQDLAPEFRRAWPDCSMWAISTRLWHFPEEFEAGRLSGDFDRFIPSKPLRRPLKERIAGKLTRSAQALLPYRERIAPPPSIFTAYPEVFPGKNAIGFDFVITPNDRSFPELDLIQAFQAARTPVGLVQESIRRDDWTEASSKLRWNGQGGCDVVYAWGETSRDYYLRAAVQPERIVLTGSPRIDRYVRRQPPVGLREQLQLPAERPVVLIATNPVYNMALRQPLTRAAFAHAVGRALDWAREIGAYAVVKPHQLELREFHNLGIDEWLANSPHAAYRPDIELSAAVHASDAVLIFNSTVALEAALLGKPSGMLAVDEYGHGADFLNTGLSCRIDSAEDLRMLLNPLSAAARAGIGRYLAGCAGSARRIVEHVAQRLESR
jgi:hypothetical protein